MRRPTSNGSFQGVDGLDDLRMPYSRDLDGMFSFIAVFDQFLFLLKSSFFMVIPLVLFLARRKASSAVFCGEA